VSVCQLKDCTTLYLYVRLKDHTAVSKCRLKDHTTLYVQVEGS